MLKLDLKDKNLYYVGGVVRDEILNIPSLDVDFCYVGNAIEFTKNMNVIKTNPDFGTVRIMCEGQEIDIASTREECYPKCGHLPLVTKIGCPLKDDLKRRDFTINALAKNTLTGELVDYFNGVDDIKEKKLKVLHKDSFKEDPSRIIRGLKFSVRFDFEPDETTQNLQKEYLDYINYDMSYHRIKKELKETFNLNKPLAYKRFIEQGIYKLLGKNQTVPELKAEQKKFVEEFKPKYIWLIYLGAFNLENLDLTVEEADIVNSYNLIKQKTVNSEKEIIKTFENIPIESVILYGLYNNYEVAYNYLKTLRYIKIQTTGAELKKMGIPEGKIYKRIFEYLLEEKLKNKDISLEDELNLVRTKFV